MAKQSKTLWSVTKAVAKEWKNDNVPRQAAAISYYTVFTLPSFLLILITIAALVVGRETIEEQVFQSIAAAAGSGTADSLREGLQNMQTVRANPILTIVGIVTLLLGATGVFRELQTSLHEILRMRHHAHGWLHSLKSFVVSFSLIIITGFMLLVSTLFTAGIAAFSRWLSPLLPLPQQVLFGIDALITGLSTFILFLLLYRFLPERPFPWKALAAGAAVATLLFGIGKFALGTYVSAMNVGAQYGAAATILVLLTWIYYASMVFLTGAEVIDQLSPKTGRKA